MYGEWQLHCGLCVGGVYSTQTDSQQLVYRTVTTVGMSRVIIE